MLIELQGKRVLQYNIVFTLTTFTYSKYKITPKTAREPSKKVRKHTVITTTLPEYPDNHSQVKQSFISNSHHNSEEKKESRSKNLIAGLKKFLQFIVNN
jgi:hypothetical protein